MRRTVPFSRPSAISALVALWVLVVTVAVLLAVTVATAEAAGATVRLTTRATPATVTVDVGDAVTIRNDDDERHRLRARDPEDVDTGNIEPGEEADVPLPVAGRYVLVDERTEDPVYEVTVEVRPAGASPVAPSAAPPGPSGASGGSAPAAVAPSSATVTIPDDVFSPRSVTIATGGTVTWQNRDGNHTVTARDRTWDSGTFDEGGSYQRRFPEPGTFAYLCLLHSDMTGTVEVVGAAGGTTPADPPSPSPAASVAPSSARDGTRHELRIADFAYVPGTLEVAPGDTLVWINEDEAPHTVTSSADGPLSSETLVTGDRYEVVVEAAGDLAYVCALHPEMTGEIVVTAATASHAETPATAGTSTRASAPSGARGSDGGGSLPEVAAIMLLFMGITFTIGRVTARG